MGNQSYGTTTNKGCVWRQGSTAWGSLFSGGLKPGLRQLRNSSKLSFQSAFSSESSMRASTHRLLGEKYYYRLSVFPSINFMCKKILLAKIKFKYKSSTNSAQTHVKRKKNPKHLNTLRCKSPNVPEQVVALLVCVGLQLCHWLVLLDEFEELWGVQLRISAVKLLQRHGQTVVYICSPPVNSEFN